MAAMSFCKVSWSTSLKYRSFLRILSSSSLSFVAPVTMCFWRSSSSRGEKTISFMWSGMLDIIAWNRGLSGLGAVSTTPATPVWVKAVGNRGRAGLWSGCLFNSRSSSLVNDPSSSTGTCAFSKAVGTRTRALRIVGAVLALSSPSSSDSDASSANLTCAWPSSSSSSCASFTSTNFVGTRLRTVACIWPDSASSCVSLTLSFPRNRTSRFGDESSSSS
mmetsp:Transcript_52765/g.126267  ORF Transcript_52765/g.126267 Transcript_52765/m.126267 type:complete len:219 (-) Transcript_52765:513-1169(-)